MNQHRYQTFSCTEVQDILEAYLADALDARTDARVAAHLAVCSQCQDEVRLEQTLDKVLAELPRPEPPPEIFQTVAAYVRAHPDAGGWFYRVKKVFRNLGAVPGNLVDIARSAVTSSVLLRVGVAVCCIGILLSGVYLHQQRQAQVAQASRDFHYAFSTVHYAVVQTDLVVNESLAAVQFDDASRDALKRMARVSTAIQRSLAILNGLTANVPKAEHRQKGDTP